MKKLGLMIAMILFLFTACGKKSATDQLASTETISATTVATTVATPSLQESDISEDFAKAAEQNTIPAASYQNAPTYAAFQRALRIIHDELYWPGLADKIDPLGGIENEQFAILDIDEDGGRRAAGFCK